MKNLLCALVLIAPVPVLAGTGVAFADTPSCAHPTIVGTPKGDRLVGTPGPDVIAGLGGHDILDGDAGDDVLCGGPDADILRGGDGDDRLLGGRDRILEDPRAGRTSFGDRLDGGPGDDWLDGGHDLRADAVDIVDANLDTLDYRESPSGVTVRLDRQVANGYGTDHIVVRERYAVLTSDHADVVHGSDHEENIRTGKGPDLVHAGGGRDLVMLDTGVSSTDADTGFGDAGNDTVWASGGSDRVAGGPGRDQVSDEGLLGTDVLLGGGGVHDLVINAISTDSGERADGGPGRHDHIWNIDDEDAHPAAVMTCVGFEVWRDSGPWC